MKNIFYKLFQAAVIITFSAVNTFPQQVAENPSPAAEVPKNQAEQKKESSANLTKDKGVVSGSVFAESKNVKSLERVGVSSAEPFALTVEEAIRLALDNNNEIRVAETDVRIAEYDLKAARSAFDPVFESENYYERSVMPTASVLEGGADGKLKQSGFYNNFAVRGAVPRFGGSYRFEFNNSRTNTNSPFSSLNLQYPSSFSLNFTQPLWRGLRRDENRRRVAVAKKNISLFDAQFRQRAIEIIEQTEAAYWDLAFALKNLQVQRDAVAAAQTQLESLRRQIEQGVLAPIDQVQAETQIANFKQNLYAAQEQATRSENNLKRLLLTDRNHPVWSQTVIPISPANLAAPRLSLTDAVKSALENRPEIARRQTNAEINQINTRFQREQTKPRVDLIAVYRADGLAGSLSANNNSGDVFGGDRALRDRVNELSNRAGLPPLLPPPSTNSNIVPGNLIGGGGRSLSNLFSQNYPTFRVGVRVEIPFGNRAAKAELGRALAEGTRLEYERKQIEQDIEAEVRNALQAVSSGEERLRAATDARVAAEKQYEGERRQFTAGTSTVFLVLERQTALVAAQGREIESQTNLRKVIANLRRVIGGTLDQSNITLLIDVRRQETVER
ncbi:MAG: TolC family protein [Acidobacteriota bacterium]|nr:TolC family protein [Acidobacteriota bacterium]